MLASLVALETDEQRATMRRLIEASDVNVTATLVIIEHLWSMVMELI